MEQAKKECSSSRSCMDFEYKNRVGMASAIGWRVGSGSDVELFWKFQLLRLEAAFVKQCQG